MEKRAILTGTAVPYALLLPQLAITVVFFYWPASQALWQSFLLEDAFGLSSEFVGFENYRALFAQPEYYRAMVTTAVFSTPRSRSPARSCSRPRPTRTSRRRRASRPS
jgi:sn-glycerol 3-phosphate transport system permease protein